MEKQKLNSVLCRLAIGLLVIFNLYYFVFKRAYVLISPAHDDILTKPVYQALREEYTQLNQRLKGEKCILFIGDSITKGFHLQEYFPKYKIVNRGIYFDTTSGLLDRLGQNADNLDPVKIFIQIGHNDLRYRTNEEILKNIADIIKQFKSDVLYMQSVLPVGRRLKEFNRRITDINQGIGDLCKKYGCTYVNLYDHFLDKNAGELYHEYSYDGVHLNRHGYVLWAKIIEPFLER